MRLTVEFDTEWWRVRNWWRRSLCRVFGHPGFQERTPQILSAYLMPWSFDDDRPRCVRCVAPDPSLPEPERKTFFYRFSDEAR